MNFQQLEYVIAVHEHKHFGEAADRCHITQATLSAMIKKLEEELDIILFDRSKYPVKTTDAGIEFIKHAREVLIHRNKLTNIGKHQTEKLEGKLTIGIIPTIANSLLPIILPDLLKENPTLELNIQEITTADIVQQLKTDKIDLGILATPLEDDIIEESIIYYEPMMVYGVSESSKKYVTSKDIKDKKIWLLEEGNCFREQSITICDIKGKDSEHENLNFEGGSFDTLLNITDMMGGFTLIPELYYKMLPDVKKKRAKAFKAPIPVREISLVSYRPLVKQQTTAYLNAFISERVKPHLSTDGYAKTDLEIIGI
jgi:LysR family hydrogen peroxide-inducible transcriptional activator